jgi:nucleoid-associated protein YgaU
MTAPEGLRALGATAGSTALAAALAVPLPHRLAAAAVPHTTVEAVVLAAALLTGVVAAATLAVGCWALTLSTVVRATGRRVSALERAADALTPAVLRRVVAAGVGVGLGLVGTTTASAVEPDLGWTPTAATSPGTSVVAGGATEHTTPVATTAHAAPVTVTEHTAPAAADEVRLDGAATLPTATSAPPPAPAPTVAVQAGDTLWDLAADALGGTPTDADVAAAWPRWHEANRDVIGADPDVLLPGQVLTVPSAGASSTVVSTTGPTAEAADR